ncbi:hypothetical protein AK812_SmicGene24227 [Symbiodinium microadriaticum]|uniref:Uncharacterized protein n=1 Tax=Symbiodinium microadriaticum TaxID=2951 RepID=A0A1Q9DFB9_SYMMI|nr:hypothetical protein AK812_SmicGene24227 [Symbiodinium microadriaticum]
MVEVSGITPEDDEEAQVEIDVSASSKGGPEAKAAGSWMQGQGAKLISRALRPERLREAILAAEVAQAEKPEVERARRAREEEMAAEAARSVAATKQKRIAEEARQQEDQSRVRAHPVGGLAPVLLGALGVYPKPPPRVACGTLIDVFIRKMMPLQTLAGVVVLALSDASAPHLLRKEHFHSPTYSLQVDAEAEWERYGAAAEAAQAERLAAFGGPRAPTGHHVDHLAGFAAAAAELNALMSPPPKDF